MSEPNFDEYSDFAGFINGFQASNLESIQRNIALQTSEIQTRLTVIQGLVHASLPDLDSDFLQIEREFRNPSRTIVDRLEAASEGLTALLIAHGHTVKSNPRIYFQITRLIRTFIEAAEESRNDRIIKAAIKVAEAFQESNVTEKV